MLRERLLANSGLGSDPEWRRQFVFAAKVVAIFHLVAACFSSGFYQSDEHFQILEFTASSSMARTRGNRSSPTAQPRRSIYCRRRWPYHC